MKLEKRSESGTPQETCSTPCVNKQKPVLIYILILFTVAFALILLSFGMHQRSNQQVLGELYNNVNALENLQEALEENLLLEKQLEDAAASSESLSKELAATQESVSALEKQVEALTYLHCLQQSYSANRLADCQQYLEIMEGNDYVSALPQSSGSNTITSPAQRYLQLKEAVELKIAEAEE